MTRDRLKDVLNEQVPVLTGTELKMHVSQGLQRGVSHLQRFCWKNLLHMVCRKATQAVA